METGTGVLSAPGSLGNCCHGPTLVMSSDLEVTLFILCVQCNAMQCNVHTYLLKFVFLFGANMDKKKDILLTLASFSEDWQCSS